MSHCCGLISLLDSFFRTADLVERSLRPPTPDPALGADGGEGGQRSGSDELSAGLSLDYCKRMKPLQFDTCTMVRERSDGSVTFVVPHFHSTIVQQQHSAGAATSASRSRRLAQETVTLSTSLPLSESSSVFVRCDEDRLDVMKALITGASLPSSLLFLEKLPNTSSHVEFIRYELQNACIGAMDVSALMFR